MSPDVKPFSSPGFRAHYTGDAGECCAVCGRFVVRPARWVRVVDGGERFARRGEGQPDEGADLGVWVVGPDCAARLDDQTLFESHNGAERLNNG